MNLIIERIHETGSVKRTRVAAYKKQVRQVEVYVKSDVSYFMEQYGFDISDWEVHATWETNDRVDIVFTRPSTQASVRVSRRVSSGFIQVGFGTM